MEEIDDEDPEESKFANFESGSSCTVATLVRPSRLQRRGSARLPQPPQPLPRRPPLLLPPRKHQRHRIRQATALALARRVRRVSEPKLEYPARPRAALDLRGVEQCGGPDECGGGVQRDCDLLWVLAELHLRKKARGIAKPELACDVLVWCLGVLADVWSGLVLVRPRRVRVIRRAGPLLLTRHLHPTTRQDGRTHIIGVSGGRTGRLRIAASISSLLKFCVPGTTRSLALPKGGPAS